MIGRTSSPPQVPPARADTWGMYRALLFLRRHAVAIVGVLLAVALIAGATHVLVTDVLPFDWTSTGAGVSPAPEVVQLP